MRTRVGAVVLVVSTVLGPLPAAFTTEPASLPEVTRVHGANRAATAAAVALVTHPDRAATVVIATGATFPDALAAVPVARSADAPLLLAARDRLPSPTRAALRRLGPADVIVFGGRRAISRAVEGAVAAALPDVRIRRIAGATRYGTAAAAALHRPSGPVARVYVASGEDFPDSFVAGATAAGDGDGLLLTRQRSLPPETAAALRDLHPPEVVVVGGDAAISLTVEHQLHALAPSVVRVAGVDRYGTAAALNRQRARSGGRHPVIVRGDDFADGLAAGPLAARTQAPMLLARSTCMPAPTLSELEIGSAGSVTLVGGPAALGPHVAALIPCAVVHAEGLSVPWGIAFHGDSVFVGERDRGRILRLDPGSPPAVAHHVAVDPIGSGGLLGLAHRPGDEEVLYAYITTATDNRVVRVVLGESVEPVLTGIPRGDGHFGGGLLFGDDGLLYVATGDGRRPDAPRAAQDTADLGGKVLRIRPDGQIPEDNPIPGSPVYAWGFRNPQGLAQEDRGWLLATDFGPDQDDEINRVLPGGNYGWPEATGATDRPGFVDPLVSRQPHEASWSGLTVLRRGGIPAWRGSMIAGALRGQRLWRFEPDPDDGVGGGEALFVGRYGRLRTVAEAPDGSLWFTTSNRDNRGPRPRAVDDRVIRIGPPMGASG